MWGTGILGTGPNICPTSGTNSLLTQPGSPSSLPLPTPTPGTWTKDRTFRNTLELKPLSLLWNQRPGDITLGSNTRLLPCPRLGTGFK